MQANIKHHLRYLPEGHAGFSPDRSSGEKNVCECLRVSAVNKKTNLAIQNLCDVHHLNSGAHAAELALDIHQAAHITAHHHIRSGIHNVFDFIRHHGIGDIGIFH